MTRWKGTGRGLFFDVFLSLALRQSRTLRYKSVQIFFLLPLNNVHACTILVYSHHAVFEQIFNLVDATSVNRAKLSFVCSRPLLSLYLVAYNDETMLRKWRGATHALTKQESPDYVIAYLFLFQFFFQLWQCSWLTARARRNISQAGKDFRACDMLVATNEWFRRKNLMLPVSPLV